MPAKFSRIQSTQDLPVLACVVAGGGIIAHTLCITAIHPLLALSVVDTVVHTEPCGANRQSWRKRYQIFFFFLFIFIFIQWYSSYTHFLSDKMCMWPFFIPLLLGQLYSPSSYILSSRVDFCLLHFHVSKQWFAWQCLEFLTCTQIFMQVTGHWAVRRV